MWIGYETVNFLEGLGSIAVFAAIQMGVILVALGLMTCKVNCPCKWAHNIFTRSAAWSTSLIFLNGTFFEILICVSISMSMLPYSNEYLGSSDRVSIGFALLFLALLVAYLGFVG